MDRNKLRTIRRNRRKRGIRKHITGDAERPRLTVYRSLNHIYAQVIDDLRGKTLAAASSRDKGHSGPTGNVEGAKLIGTRLAERAKEAGVDNVVFDRNGLLFHGRVKALADAAREGGLKF
ncbi:MAG: 50S ribosomal protein L18 [Phycisphaerales bacterium]|nr:50S ribosomal protein L18 [Phycisphaerales bacterium]